VNNHNLPNWFIKKYLIPESFHYQFLVSRYPSQIDPGYHIGFKGQQYIADEYLKLIKERM
jgi:hypothetical protein